MKRPAACFLFALLLSGCAGEQTSLLDQELLTYRYEQEKYRREDLEALYREEAALSDEISERILALREEIAAKEEELEKLEAELMDLEEAIRAARAKATAATPPDKPKPAGEKPQDGKPESGKPGPDPVKTVPKPPAK